MWVLLENPSQAVVWSIWKVTYLIYSLHNRVRYSGRYTGCFRFNECPCFPALISKYERRSLGGARFTG